MDITKDFYDYVASNSNNIPNYSFRCETGSAMNKCNRILEMIIEAETNINQVSSISKTSSAFNDRHLKFSNASTKIKTLLIEIEKEIKIFRERYLNSGTINKHQRKLIENSFDILNSRTSDLTMKFQKFLQKQAELIKKVEQRKNNLSMYSSSTKDSINEFVNVNENEEGEDDKDILIDVQIQDKKNNYYQERLSGAQLIEKTMGELSNMMKRMSQMTYHHSLMIDNIEKNTDLALDNVEKGTNEIQKIYDDVKNNRKLLIKIFGIIIFTAVVYIIFFA